MGRVDRDIDAVIDFCKEFRSKYLEEMEKAANNLTVVGSQISAVTGGTPFASRSEQEVLQMAENIKNAVYMGEARILELEKRMTDDRERGRAFER